ncbi:MAG: O-methyltransferase [candidate division Zixibacteria bacterium]|nr:O-methyltransferase [candidate division Zixibacteria bacterium]MDH3938103.1 O-methyltransferase [candidate division Zixibacteria bacterium]MDH4032964.1 O-methyltransferase [candidate division Zixibacteria bacterium]
MFDKIHQYLETVTPERPPVLREMEEYASEHKFPIVGPLVGRLLYQLTLATKARKICELGSGFGYSAYWFSMAIRSRGSVLMVDSDKRNKRLAFNYFKKAALQSQFEFRVGDALGILKKNDGPFDIIFNDINKDGYPKVIDAVATRLKKNGLFITDNLIWSGRVLDKKPDVTTKAIQEFTRVLYNDSRFFTTILPLRDGVSIAVRL